MAMPRQIPVDFGDAFPHGVYAFATTEVQAARDFDRSKPGAPVQAVDEDSGLPVWSIDVMDADPEVRKNNLAITVRIVAERCPSLPAAPAGWPVRPLEFEGLKATPYVADSPMGNGRGRLAWSFRATGVRTPKQSGAAGSAPSSGKADAGKGEAVKGEAA